MTSRLGQCLLVIAALVCLAAPFAESQSVLTRHVPQAVATGRAPGIGRLPAGQQMSLDLVLPLRDPDGLKGLLADLSNPLSPSYRHFLTPPQFTVRFGPTVEHYEAVKSYAENHGLKVTGGTRDGMEVQVKGPVSAVEAAFHIEMRTYTHPTENRVFYSPDREPTTDLPFDLWHISGLDDYSIPRPMYVKKSDYGTKQGTPLQNNLGSGPGGGFLGSDMRAAYYGTGPLTGAGQNLGLFEYYGTNLIDLDTYFARVGQVNTVPITLLSVDGTSTACGYDPTEPNENFQCPDDLEQTLDMTQAIGMAPGLASLTVYIGELDSTIFSAMTTHDPLPTTISVSWHIGWDLGFGEPYFEKMAAQGQSIFVASGDSGYWSAGQVDFLWPADDAYVVSVGGTDLVTSSAGGPWASETAWSDSGGGISLDATPIPSWQLLPGVINTSNQGSTTLRNGPDVSAEAGGPFYVCADQGCEPDYDGTSFAAPMWAGFIALANQQLASQGNPPVGFLNPIIYQQNIIPSAYAADFHDIASGNNGDFNAVPGYDLVTGWGSPTPALIDALASGISLAASPSSLSIGEGSSSSTTITSSVPAGFSSAITLSALGLPAGVTASFSSPTITGAGTSTVTFTTTPTAPVGTYIVTITGTSGATVVTSTVTLIVVDPFSLAVWPSSLVVISGLPTSATVTSLVAAGFNSAIALSASGLPGGVRASFSSPTIIGAGTSTVTFSANPSAGGSWGVGAGDNAWLVDISGVSATTTEDAVVEIIVEEPFSVSASSQAASVVAGSSVTAQVTTATIVGFNPAINLSASGLPPGATASFSSPTIVGAGASTVTFTTAATTQPGNYAVTLLGTSGNIGESTPISLIVLSATTTALVASPNPSTSGQPVVFMATVTSLGPTPTGTVDFYSGGGTTLMGTATLSGGVATYVISSLSMGTHHIVAKYVASRTDAASESTVVDQVVLRSTTTTLSSSVNPSTSGQSVIFTATVTSSGPTPNGTVGFYSGSGTTLMGTATLSGGVATYTTSSLSAATHHIVAKYVASGTDAASESTVLEQVVLSSTTTTLTSSLNPSTSGQSVKFTATVTSSGTPTPTGTVGFYSGGGTTLMGTEKLSGGVATYTTSSLSVATHHIVAKYVASGSDAASESAVLDQVVLRPTTTTLTSSLNPSTSGQSVKFTATVTSSGATPAGTVGFYSGSGTTLMGAATLSGGVATYKTSSLSVATHHIVAKYVASGSNAASESPVLDQVVNK